MVTFFFLNFVLNLKNIYNQASLVINISDNGTGFDQDEIKAKKHIGIANVNERLKLAFVKSSFETESIINKGTTTKIIIAEKDLVL